MKNMIGAAGLAGLLALFGCTSTASEDAPMEAAVVSTVTLEVSGMT